MHNSLDRMERKPPTVVTMERAGFPKLTVSALWQAPHADFLGREYFSVQQME